MSSSLATVFAQLAVARQAFDVMTPSREISWHHGNVETMILNIDGGTLRNTRKQFLRFG